MGRAMRTEKKGTEKDRNGKRGATGNTERASWGGEQPFYIQTVHGAPVPRGK